MSKLNENIELFKCYVRASHFTKKEEDNGMERNLPSPKLIKLARFFSVQDRPTTRSAKPSKLRSAATKEMGKPKE